jgi:hypothetical protein
MELGAFLAPPDINTYLVCYACAATPKRAAFVQYSELLLLNRMHESRIGFLIVGGTVAYA